MGKKKKLKFKNLPEHKKLLWLIADNVTRNDVMFLSELDYGRDVEKHAELITNFKQTLDTSKIESWHPMEVWELNRWSAPSYTDTIGHSRRAFSCAALMACYFDGVASTIESLDVLLPLFESLVRLDLLDWQKHFSNFLLHGIEVSRYPEVKFSLQLTYFLSFQYKQADHSALRIRYDQLMIEEISMLKHHWESQWNETWDPALEPEIERPAKIIETHITHGSAHMFSAKCVYQTAEQINDTALCTELKTLARRIAWLGDDDIDEFLPTSTICL